MNIQVGGAPAVMHTFAGQPGETITLPDDVFRLAAGLGFIEPEPAAEDQPASTPAPAPRSKRPATRK